MAHSLPADLVLPTSKESIEPMDGLSLALALLAWALIALLSFFVGIIVLRALRHAMDAAKRVGQIFRQEQPARMTDVAPASI